MITGINHITLSTCHLETSFHFYKDILKFKPLVKWERGAYFLAGNVWFCLSLDPDFKNQRQKGHIAFTATAEFLEEIQRKVNLGTLKQWTDNTSEGNSVYILDPSGNQLELHVGTWETRLHSIKEKPYSGEIEFY